MSEQAHETTETQSAVTVSDHGGVLMRISRVGLWVNPDIPADECAQRVLASLRPILSHTIDTEVQIQVARLTAERDTARAEVERLRANDQALLDRSRPTDEDIWREAFMAAVRSRDFHRTKMADEVLAEYRKRWPR